MFGLCQLLATEIMERLLHRVERGRARWRECRTRPSHGSSRAFSRRTARWAGKLSPFLIRNSAIVIRFSVRVPVLSVHNTVAEPSVSMAAARRVSTRAREIRQAPIAMNTVSTTGNFFGQHRHAERDAGEHRVEPSAAQSAVEQHRQDAHRTPDHGEHPHEPAGLCLQPRRLGLQRAERLADLADFAQCADRDHLADSGPAHDQRTGKHIRQVIAARPVTLATERHR